MERPGRHGRPEDGKEERDSEKREIGKSGNGEAEKKKWGKKNKKRPSFRPQQRA
jgi:hypothetical protein